MGATPQARKGHFNRTLALAIAAGIAVSGVQVAAPATSPLAAPAAVAQTKPQGMEFPEIQKTGLSTYAINGGILGRPAFNFFNGSVGTEFSHMEGTKGYYDVYIMSPNGAALEKGITNGKRTRSMEDAFRRGFTHTVGVDGSGYRGAVETNKGVIDTEKYTGRISGKDGLDYTHFKKNPDAKPLDKRFEYRASDPKGAFFIDVPGGQSPTEDTIAYIVRGGIVVDYAKHDYTVEGNAPKLNAKSLVKGSSKKPIIGNFNGDGGAIAIKPLADVQNPKPKDVNLKVGDKVPSADTAIVPDSVFRTKKIEWVTPPNTKTPGKQTGKVRLTYDDGTTDEVNVPVIVNDPAPVVPPTTPKPTPKPTPTTEKPTPKPTPTTEKPTPTQKDADKHQPKPVTQHVKYNDAPTTDPAKLFSNWKEMPEGTTAVGVNLPKNVTKNTTLKYKVTYPDKSSETVDVPYKVGTMADAYVPVPKPIEAPLNSEPKPTEGIKNPSALPDGTTYTWEKKPDTSRPGNTDGTLKVSYPDKSSERITVPVTVTTMADKHTPEPKQIEASLNKVPPASDGIANLGKLPKGTKVTWKTKPDVSKKGKSTGVALVTYPDGTTDTVKVPVNTTSMADKYDPKPKPLTSWTGETPPAIDGILDPGKLPAGTKFDWEKKPDTSRPGHTTGVVKVTYPDGSVDRVTVPVDVFLSGDDYDKLIKDIDNLEKEIDRLDKGLEDLTGEVNKLKRDLDRLTGEVGKLKKRADEIEKRLDGHDKDIAGLKDRMTKAENRLTRIENDIKKIKAELERLDGQDIRTIVRNPDNSLTVIRNNGDSFDVDQPYRYGLEKCTAQLGGGLMALIPTMLVLSQVGNAVNLPGMDAQIANFQRQIGVYNPQVADFVGKNGGAIAAGLAGLTALGVMFIPGTCGSDSIADALGESLRGNKNAVNPDVNETHELNGSSRFVPKQDADAPTDAPAGSSDKAPADTPAGSSDAAPTGSSDKAPETAAGAALDAPVVDTDVAEAANQ